MGEAREESMEEHSFQKLDFNLPLLSTRRLCTNTIQEHSSATAHSHFASRDTSNRIPFCWEKAPGKPKDLERNDFPEETGDITPRPRLPPCRWHPQNGVDNDNKEHAVNVLYHDDGCDADVDDDEEGDDDVVYSDALDVLSLTEAIDIAQKAEDQDHGLDGLNLESEELSHHGRSPNFMIERFLPDATALAASSSALYASKNLNKKLAYYSCNHGNEFASAKVGPPYRNSSSEQSSHTKGCGLEVLLPWRIKHRLCGVKSSASHFSPTYVRPNCNPKRKKDCSAHGLRN